MTLLGALAAGAAVGLRHAVEADHVAAVATLVDEEQDVSRSATVGASWGLGHSLTVVGAGLAVLLLGVHPPETVTAAFEALVGVVLVGLGAWTLLAVLGPVDVRRHRHGDAGDGSADDGGHRHLLFGDHSLGVSHHHLDADSALVGVVHGFAGSGGLVVLLVATAPSLDAGVAFLGGFAALSVVTMAAVTAVWGRALATGTARYLRAGSGALSVGVGALLLAETLPAVAAVL